MRTLYYGNPLYSFLQDRVEAPSALVLTPTPLLPGDAHNGALIAKGSFCFIGHTEEFTARKVSWYPQTASHLWQFNLHYYDWLADLKAANNVTVAQELIEDWLLNCDHFHKISWHPYPLSLRIANWCTYGEWLLRDASPSLREAFMHSLARQVRHLEHNLEYDLGANHLIKNLKALIVAGLCLPHHQTLYLEALRLLIHELNTQIMSDGSHYERSPLYHVQVFQDVLDVQAIMRKAHMHIPPQLDIAVEKMAAATQFFRHPDGCLALFNDSAEGDKRKIDQLLLCSGFDHSPQGDHLSSAGYMKIARSPITVFMDAGLVGPDEIPGHAHADTLSIEVSIGAQRVIVNSGTYAYQHEMRHYFRSTAAHSTVSVDDRDSAEVWSAFRVGRRPRQVKGAVRALATATCLEGAHDGYRHIGVAVTRKVTVPDDGSSMAVSEELTLKKYQGRRVLGRLHIHPLVMLKQVSEQEIIITLPNGKQWQLTAEGARMYTQESWYAPQFGEKAASSQIVLQPRISGRSCVFGWQLKPLNT